MGILLTNIERNHYIDRSPWTPYWSDCMKTTYDPYLEFFDNRPNLVICYGDSWTWGDSLVKNITGSIIDQPEIRLNNIYGRRLADLLNADFVNCAIPGIYNYWIIDRLNILLNHDLDKLRQKYDKIYIVVTLTEIGRDFVFEKYCVDFENFFPVDANTDPETICKACEKFDFNKIKEIEQHLPNNVKLVVGRNFTHTFIENQTNIDFLLPKSWSDLLFAVQDFKFDCNVPIMSHGIGHLLDYLKRKNLYNESYKKWFVTELHPKATKQINLLNCSKLNYQKGTKHPTPEGHKIWADYVFSYLDLD